MKAYRRLQPGVSPDLEIGRFLTEEAEFYNTPPLAGAVEYTRPDAEPITLGILQGFVPNQGDGWTYTLDYLSRYLEDRLVTSWSLEGGESQVRESEAVDSFFTGLMHILGLRTGELHEAFAIPTGDPAFAAEPVSAEEASEWVENVLSELKQTFKVLKKRRDRLPEAVAADVERLLERRAELAARIKSVPVGDLDILKTRHHGDYHLGQVLVAGGDFQIIDFEGEPARPLAERRRKQSPLRDVAGMLRSFSYAARSALAGVSAERGDRAGELESWARLWEERTREIFLEGYREGARECPSYPADPEHARKLIELFMLEKALYEVRYELDNRPEWLWIPVRGILDLLDEPAGTEETL